MTTERIDVLSVMDRDATFAAQRHHMMPAALMFGERQHYEAESLAARAAVAELIEAQRMAHDAMLLADWNVPGKVSERKHAAYLASAAALARVSGGAA